ncbi:uncharacterized protein LOC133708382 [Rosa rugosa]|uniref:uncharacterized protein LOC133708382 n=1 Tax=Rosa rugosa TaxID=74645 RepID=UPI002B416DEB|nr:uncharacterized protein LOC133708382 [Rosa rugosa]
MIHLPRQCKWQAVQRSGNHEALSYIMNITMKWPQCALKELVTLTGKGGLKLLALKLLLTVCEHQIPKRLNLFVEKLLKYLMLLARQILLRDVFLIWGSMKEQLGYIWKNVETLNFKELQNVFH